MRKRFLTLLASLVLAFTAGLGAATIENDFFSVTTLDDSWLLSNDDALRPYGARVDVMRGDARGATLELARIDYIEGAFSPELYLKKQIIERKDVFARSATEISAVFPSYFANREVPTVTFKKTSNGHAYDCEALAFNAGYGTCFIIMAHRAGEPTLIRRLAGGITFKVDTASLTTAAQYVAAANAVVTRHHLPIGNNEHLCKVAMSGDSATVTLNVTVPYITRENVNVPSFVMAKRDAWFKQAPEALRFNLLLAQATAEGKNLRYFYADTKGNEIGTLLILPEEYEQVLAANMAQDSKPAESPQAVPETAPEATAQLAAPAVEQNPVKQEPAPAQEAESAVITHVVKSGENLSKIAKRYGVTMAQIKDDNPGLNVNQIKIGQKLIIKR